MRSTARFNLNPWPLDHNISGNVSWDAMRYLIPHPLPCLRHTSLTPLSRLLLTQTVRQPNDWLPSALLVVPQRGRRIRHCHRCRMVLCRCTAHADTDYYTDICTATRELGPHATTQSDEPWNLCNDDPINKHSPGGDTSWILTYTTISEKS